MAMLISFWQLIVYLTRSFLRHGCGSLAASLAFFSLLSLFPLVFMLLYGVSFIVSHDVIGGQVLLSFLKGFLPTLGEGLAVALQGAVGLLLILSYVATQTVNFLTAYAPHLWGLNLIALAAHDLFLTYTLPFTMAFLAVGALYRYVPRRRPQWRDALIGSLTFSLLWVAAKLIFVTYNEYATVYTKLYGSLLEIVLLLLWIYYSALLFLLGAVIAHVLQQRTQAAAAAGFVQAGMASPPSPASR